VRDIWLKGKEGGGRRHPATGVDILVTAEEISERHLVGEMTKPGQTMMVVRGGRGGKGNAAFKTHSNTAPWIAEVGEAGIGRWLEIELKMVADVGIVGVPNAGKSSLLSAVTEKQAKIAAYPFTTVVPNVGHWRKDVHGGMTLCDLPGLIQGASEGRGMGFQFLRHIERCRALIHVISGDSEDPVGDFELIQKELRDYSEE
ncbi:unnamed protein product, partial [Polarella glacialis]